MSDILSKLKTPYDLKNLNNKDLLELSGELRNEIIKTVSENGGHLASNLGVIELTIALLREFEFEKDRIVWDVGHQTYAYKILTGRYGQFCTLRKMGGLAGFPKRCESIFDCFNTGHSSTSISAALGMKRANKIMGESSKVIAVIGDGALTGGMALEALNDAGQSNTDLIVILNDNQMSINSNVGGLAKHLESIRISSKYLRLKSKTYRILNKTRLGKFISYIIDIAKSGFKDFLRKQKVIFEDLGFKYYGPIDGHDIEELQKHLKAAKKIDGPILIHVLTQKGKGYEYAEVSPEKFHGIAPFEVSNGLVKGSELKQENHKSFSDAFGSALEEFAQNDPLISVVCPAMISGTGLDGFASKFKDRLFDVGIAEQHALTMAAGMACQGLKPVVAIYSTFLQRAYDQLLHDIALQNLHVVLCIDRAGVVGEDGETHQGIFDLSLLLTVPNITVLSPRNYSELGIMMNYALNKCYGPVAIRYPRGKEKLIDESNVDLKDDNSIIEPIKIQKGNDITLIAEGAMVEKAYLACEKLKKENISCDLIDLRKIKPLDTKLIFESALKTGKVITLENGISECGIGSYIEGKLSENDINVKIKRIGVKDNVLVHGKVDELYKSQSMDEDSICDLIRKML